MSTWKGKIFAHKIEGNYFKVVTPYLISNCYDTNCKRVWALCGINGVFSAKTQDT